MRVIVDEARDNRAPAQVDNLRAALLTVNRFTNRQDAFAADAHGGHRAIGGIDREDVAVNEDQVLTAGTGLGG